MAIKKCSDCIIKINKATVGETREIWSFTINETSLCTVSRKNSLNEAITVLKNEFKWINNNQKFSFNFESF